MPAGFPDALRRAAKRFVNDYGGQLRPFEDEHEVTPGVVVRRTGGHTPGHSVVRLASAGDRMTFAGDAVFQVGFDQPEWQTASSTTPKRRLASASNFCGVGGELRAPGGHSSAVPVPQPRGSRW